MRSLFGAAAVSLALMSGSAWAQTTTTDTFDVSLTISDSCTVSAPNDLPFGTQSGLTSALTAQADFYVNCTTDLDYGMTLTGSHTDTGSGQRYMSDGASSTVPYNLYWDSGRTNAWTESTTIDGTGTGSNDTKTVYGSVASGTTPTAGTYSDTVTVTVTY
jgi:spore coat protein U-like protein